VFLYLRLPLGVLRTPCNTKLINNDVLENTSGIVCSAIDSLKKRVLPEDGPVWLKHVVK
jgi:hypothetical protein